MSTALAKTSPIKSFLASPAVTKRFEEVLGQRAPQFLASVVTIGGTLPEDTEPASIAASCMVAATLDLPINKDLGFAWIVPYRDKGVMKAQFQMGHKGFIQLALRTGQYERMNARPVNAEAFGGYDCVGEPLIDWSKVDPEKPPIGYAFAWKLVNGFTKVCYWSREQVESHARKYSQAYAKGYNSPWKTHFDAMALKTVIKNELSDWGILSVEMRRAAKFDQAVVVDVQSEKVEFPDNATNLIEQPSFDGPPKQPDEDRVPMDYPVKAKPVEVKPVAEEPPAYEAPAAKAPHDWLPCLDADDPAGVLESLLEWISLEGLAVSDVIEFLKGSGIMKPTQSALSELSCSKLIMLLKQRESIRASVLAKE